MTPDKALQRYCTYLGTLTPDTLRDIDSFVTTDVRFKDPFNDVRGSRKLAGIFAHMFETVGPVHFDIHSVGLDGNTGLIQWTFRAKLRGKDWSFDGASKITLEADGKVSEHIDYWDPARDLYEHFPLIGWLLSRIRAKLGQASSTHSH